MMFINMYGLTDETRALHAEVQRQIVTDTSERTEVAVSACSHRGFVATAYDGPERDDAHVMASGPWRSTVRAALEELSAEWARGCE